MTQLELLMAATCVVGLVALGAGVLLRSRKVHAEHWLWKKKRLAQARLLLNGGSAVSACSAVAFFLV